MSGLRETAREGKKERETRAKKERLAQGRVLVRGTGRARKERAGESEWEREGGGESESERMIEKGREGRKERALALEKMVALTEAVKAVIFYSYDYDRYTRALGKITWKRITSPVSIGGWERREERGGKSARARKNHLKEDHVPRLYWRQTIPQCLDESLCYRRDWFVPFGIQQGHFVVEGP